MKLETIITTCDEPGCEEVHQSGRTGGRALIGSGWAHNTDGDFCPQHAPDVYWCGLCVGGFQTIESFDQHRKQCRRGRR